MKRKNKREIKKNNGITLIALVITIIILLILAGVTIATLAGDNGILTRATEANEKTKEAEVKEKVELMGQDYNIGKYTGQYEDIKKYFQKQAAKGEISRIVDNEDETYTIEKDGYEVIIDENGKVENVNKKEEIAVTEVWYKIDGTTLHFSNSDLGGYTKHDESLSTPEWSATYQNQSPITKVVFENEIAPTSTSKWFYYFTSLTEIDNIEYLHTSNVSSMYGMFFYCTELTSVNVSNFDTSNVNHMGWMFSTCENLSSIDVSAFNTSNVTSMQAMFSSCEKLKNIDVSGFNTNKVTAMHYMFGGCKNLKNIDVSEFNTSNVTAMVGMFNECSSLSDIDVSSFDTKKVTHMTYMFKNCTGLTNLDLTNFDTSSVLYSPEMLLNLTCPVYIGEKWTLTETDTGYSGTFQK